MSVLVMIYGQSGTGKSTSLRGNPVADWICHFSKEKVKMI